MTFLRWLTLASAAAAVMAGVALGAREWALLTPLALGAFVGALALARCRLPVAWAAVLGVASIAPVLFQATRGEYFPAYQLVWVAAVLGLILGGPSPFGWSMPTRWRTPLVYWAVIVALSWPIVAFREADFRWHMFDVYRASTTGLGGPPPVAALFVATVALTHLVGILFFDHLWAAATRMEWGRVRRGTLGPLLVSAVLCAMVAIYQGAIDLFWLSDHHWPFDGRAAGGLIDGDATGALLGFVVMLPWLGMATYEGRTVIARATLAAVTSGGLLAGVWMTGSRSALLAACVTIGVVTLVALADRGLRRRVLPVMLAVTLVAAVGLAVAHDRVAGPVARIRTAVDDAQHQSWRQFAEEQFFNRGAAVGTASVRMVRDHPVVGVGVAGFYQLFPDYAYVATRSRQGFDNAQSWPRHLAAEFGALGSIGWIWWTVAFGWFVLTTRGAGACRWPVGVIKASLVSIFVVCQLAMPTQVTSIAVLFWALAFAYVATLDPDVRHRVQAPARQVPAAVIGLAAVLFAAGTAWAGVHDLRPPYRAMFANWIYQRGIYETEQGPDGPFFWTEQESVSTNTAQPGYLKLEFWAGHPDLAARPLDVTLLVRDHEVERLTLRDHGRVVRYVAVPAEARQMMITTRVSRTFQASTAPDGDRRHLGLAVREWTWVEAPPPGAVVLR